MVLAGEEANGGDYPWMYCSCVHCAIETILDVRTPYDAQDTPFFRRCDFADAIADSIPAAMRTEEKKSAFVKAELAKYEPYWKKVIAIYATN